jgi:hypothetical protein
MGDLARERATGCGRFDELHVEVAETHERPEVVAQSPECTCDGFEHCVALVVGRHSTVDERRGCDLDRDRARGAIVEAFRTEDRQERFQRHCVPVRLLGYRPRVFEKQLSSARTLWIGGCHPPTLPACGYYPNG